MKVLIISLICSFLVEAQMTFNQWRQIYSEAYISSSNINICRQVFDMNTAFVHAFNLMSKRTYDVGLNSFSSLTFSQFKSRYLGLVFPSTDNGTSDVIYSSSDPVVKGKTTSIKKPIPASVDYRNYTLAVQHQLSCTSCWALAVTGYLETRMMMLNASYKTPLSSQYLLDCDTLDDGCAGGFPTTALRWIVKFGGNSVPAASNYRYYGFKMKCRNTPKIPMNIKTIVQNNTAGNENLMKEVVGTVGPIMVVAYFTDFFQSYKSGIFYDSTCENNCKNFNHSLVIVGYGTNATSKMDYWIAKNSWGTSWGQNGYVFLARNKRNNCNIACYLIYAI